MVLSFLDSVVCINELFEQPNPFAIGKLGSVELDALVHFTSQVCDQQQSMFPDYLKKHLYVNAGVFPRTEAARLSFCQRLVDDLAELDVAALWSAPYPNQEAKIIQGRAPDCVAVELPALEPYYSGMPWSRHLAGKKVLVISPFAATIREQYRKRQSIWRNPDVLPQFELCALGHPLSPGVTGDSPKYESWQHMVDALKSTMNQASYEIALVGTGASSIPLIAHAKRMGKIGIHLGGALQILFGIKGGRWLSKKNVNCFFNDSWTSPSASETPIHKHLVEGGCYW